MVEGFEVVGLDHAINPFIQARDCPGMPQIGDFHPDDNQLTLQSLEPRPFKNSRDVIWVIATYRPRDLDPVNTAVVSFRATTIPVLRVYDANGVPIIIHYHQDQTYNIAIGSSGYTATRDVTFPPWAGQITDQKAVGILSLDWISSDSEIASKLLPYINGLNTNDFQGCPPYTWWVADVQIVKTKYRWGLACHVEIHYDPESWIQTIPYRDMFGVIPAGVDLKASITKGPGSYNGYVRGTLKRFMDINPIKTVTPNFDAVVPNLAALKLRTLDVPVGEYPGDPWL